MKKLTKILLVNWLYYHKEVVEVKNINFFTGKNGAGKSAFIDALQVVLLGELSANNFNKAANEKSHRSLKSYLRADRDTHNRKGKEFTSYIACEFFDDVTTKYFTLGIVFDCYKDDSEKEQYFIFDAGIPEHCFIENDVPYHRDALKKYLKANPELQAEFPSTNTRYKQTILAKWNIHTSQLFSMIKKGISFRNVNNIQTFITENVCDIPEKPDILSMQENIRLYKKQEALAQRQILQGEALSSICDKFADLEQAKLREKQQEFIVLWGKKEQIEDNLLELQNKYYKIDEELTQVTKILTELSSSIKENQEKQDELKYKRDHDDAVKEKKRLEEVKETLRKEQENLLKSLERGSKELQEEADKIAIFCKKIQEKSTLFPEFQQQAKNLQESYFDLCSQKDKLFSISLEHYQKTEALTALFQEAKTEIIFESKQKLKDFTEEISQLKSSISDLERNVKPYPKGLLTLKNRLEDEISIENTPCTITILADVLEITTGEETWRGAVEGYLNSQKFYLLVPPEHYEKSLQLFNQWKHEFPSFGLVDLKKLREKSNLTIEKSSLAEKIQTENPLAQDYISYLLGRVICCEKVEDIRNYPVALTSSGMLYKNFVARPMNKNAMNDAFIGRKAIELQLERLTLECNQLEENQEKLSQSLAPCQTPHTWLLTPRFLETEFPTLQQQFSRSLILPEEIKEVDFAISQCNLYWLDELNDTIFKLSQEIESQQEQQREKLKTQGSLEFSLKTIAQEKIPEKTREQFLAHQQVNDTFSDEYQENEGIPRYTQELQRIKSLETLLQNFTRALQVTRTNSANLQQQLLELRSIYSRNFHCTFDIKDQENQQYEKELQRINESALPAYQAKINAARESAMEQFQNQFLDKLKSGIDQVRRQVNDLNKALKDAQFGNDRYQFKVSKSPDYADYYEMIMSETRMEGDVGLFAMEFEEKYANLRDDLFQKLASSDDESLNPRKQSELEKNIEIFTDFRTYLTFDMETTNKNGEKHLLSKVLHTNSGGETQTPFYIAILASFAQLYKVNDSTSSGNTLRLVVFDEAFSKMDSDRIIESVRLLRTLNLQAIVCTPPEKIQDIAPEADRTLLFINENHQMQTIYYGKEFKQNASNLNPPSLIGEI